GEERTRIAAVDDRFGLRLKQRCLHHVARALRYISPRSRIFAAELARRIDNIADRPDAAHGVRLGDTADEPVIGRRHGLNGRSLDELYIFAARCDAAGEEERGEGYSYSYSYSYRSALSCHNSHRDRSYCWWSHCSRRP